MKNSFLKCAVISRVMRHLVAVRVGSKLALSFGFLVAASAIIVATTWQMARTTTSNAQLLSEQSAPIERTVRTWQTSSVKTSEIALRSAFTRGQGDVFNLFYQVHNLTKAEDALLADIGKMIAASVAADDLGPALKAALSSRQQYLKLRGAILQNALEDKIISQKDMREHEEAMIAYLESVNKLLSVAEKISRESADQMIDSAERAQWISGASFALIVVLALGFAWVLRKSIIERLDAVSSVAMKIAGGGGLDHRIPDVPEQGDEIVAMANAFNAMVDQVDRSAQLIKKKSNDMASMLRTIPQGILSIDANNRVQSEYSAYLETILETDEIAGRDVMELVFSDTSLDSDTRAQIEAIAGACVGEDAMNFSFNRHLLVPEIEKRMPDASVKTLELTWSAIVNDEDVTEQILLCIRDVTELRKLGVEAAAQKRELEIIGQVLGVAQDKFENMLDSSYGYLEKTEGVVRESAGSAEAVNEAFKNLHTIKGNARTYALRHLAAAAHDTEQVYADLRSGKPGIEWDREQLLAGLQALRAALDEHARISREKLGRKGSSARSLSVDTKRLKEAARLLEEADASSDLGAMRRAIEHARLVLKLINSQSLSSLIEDIVNGLPGLARDLGKPAPVVRVEDGDVVFDEQAAGPINDLFMHVLCNALDHGIESPQARVLAGKPEAGSIEIDVSMQDGHARIVVRDDGRGLALWRIKALAQERGLVAPDEQIADERAAQLIFAPGFSTASQATLVSGRGVGMDAVTALLLSMGGGVRVVFEDDRAGAEFRRFALHITIDERFAVTEATKGQ